MEFIVQSFLQVSSLGEFLNFTILWFINTHQTNDIPTTLTCAEWQMLACKLAYYGETCLGSVC